MNEQDLAHELGVLLDGSTDGSSVLPAEETAFAAQLKALAEGTKADSAFAAALETRLHTPDPSFGNHLDRQKRGVTAVQRRPYYRLAALVAAVLVVTFAALTLPPVRDLVFQGAVTEEIAVVTPTTGDIPPTQAADLPPDAGVDSLVVSAPIAGGFRIMGEVLNYDGFYLGLIESTFASYIDLMWSADHDHVQS